MHTTGSREADLDVKLVLEEYCLCFPHLLKASTAGIERVPKDFLRVLLLNSANSTYILISNKVIKVLE